MTNSVAVVLSWVLVHFLWQGVALAFLGACVERFLSARNSSGRYANWLAVLALMAVAPIATGWWLWPTATAVGHSNLVQVTSSIGIAHEGTVSLLEEHAAEGREFASHPVVSAVETTSIASAVLSSPDVDLEASAWLLMLLRQHWHSVVVVLWASGVLLGLLRLCGGVAFLGWIVHTAEPVPDAWRVTAGRLAKRFGLRTVPRLVLSNWVGEPLAMQWFRPFIVLPASWACQLPPEMIEAVLAHELAHLRRYDLWVNLLQRTVETVLFFHPAVWWVSRKIRREREVCCDVWAVAVTGQAVAYAKTLEAVARCRLAWSNPALAAGMGGERMALFNRVRRVLGGEPAGRESGWWPLGLAGAGLAASCWAGVALSTTNAQGEDEVGPVSAVLAQADGEKEGDRPRPPRPEGRDGDRPPPRGEARDGDRPGPPPPRGEGDRPRPPRDGERPPEGRGPRPEGDRGPEGRPGPRPEGDRGPEGRPGPRDGEGRGPRPEGEGRPGPRPDGERGPGPGGPGGERGPGPGGFGPGAGGPPEVMRDLMMMVGELRREVQMLREEVRELRGQRPGGPGFVPPAARDGGPRPPREGAGPDGRGPRPEGDPRDGGIRPDGPPREGGPRPEGGPREGGPRPEGREGNPPRPPREGERAPEGRGPRPEGGPREGGPRPEGDRPRPPREEEGPRPERRPDAA